MISPNLGNSIVAGDENGVYPQDDSDFIGKLMHALFESHKGIAGLAGKVITSKLGTQSLPNMGGAQNQGFTLPGLNNPFQGGAQSQPGSMGSTPPAQGPTDYLAQQRDARLQGANMKAPQMGNPMDGKHALGAGLALLLSSLFKVPVSAQGGLIQGYNQGAENEAKRKFGNAQATYQQGQQAPAINADYYGQMAGTASQDADRAFKANQADLERKNNLDVQQLRNDLAKARVPASGDKVEKAYLDNIAKAKSSGERRFYGNQLRARFPDLYGNMTDEMIADMSAPTASENKDSAQATEFSARAQRHLADARLLNVKADWTPAVEGARAKMFQAIGKMDEAHAANITQATALMPREAAAKIAQAYAGVAKIRADISNIKELNAQSWAKINATVNGQNRAQITAGLQTLTSQANSIRSAIQSEQKMADAAGETGAGQHYSNMKNLNDRLGEIQGLYSELADPIQKISQAKSAAIADETAKYQAALQKVGNNPKAKAQLDAMFAARKKQLGF